MVVLFSTICNCFQVVQVVATLQLKSIWMDPWPCSCPVHDMQLTIAICRNIHEHERSNSCSTGSSYNSQSAPSAGCTRPTVAIGSLMASNLCECLAYKTNNSLVPRNHFLCLPEKWVWSTAYQNSIFIQMCWNTGAVLFSNLMLDIIKDCIPHCM